MKIEFRKVPSTAKDFSTSFASVKLEGTFCKISSLLIKVDANKRERQRMVDKT